MNILVTLSLAFFLSVPFVNKYVLEVPNLEETRREARERLSTITDLINTGEQTAAIDSIQSLKEHFSGNDDFLSSFAIQVAMFHEGNLYLKQLRFDEALEVYKELEQKYPSTPLAEQVFFIMAKAYEKKKQFDKAIEYYERIEQNREEALSFPKYRDADIEPGKYVNADVGKEIKKNPYLQSPLYTSDDADRDFNQDTTQSSAQFLSDVVIAVGRCYMKSGEAEKARKQYQIIPRFFKTSDRVDDAVAAIAETYELEGDNYAEKFEKSESPELKRKMNESYNDAVIHYRRFINAYYQSDFVGKIRISLGGVLNKLGSEKQAIEVFRDAVSSQKDVDQQAKIVLEIGKYYYEEKNYKSAIEYYSKVLTNYSATMFAANAQFLMAASYEELGDTAEAFKQYQGIADNYRASTFFAPSALRLGKRYIENKDYESALAVLRRGLTYAPNSPVAPQTQYEIGMVYFKMKEYKNAVSQFEFVVGNWEKSQWAEMASLKIGECYQKLGNTEKANAALANISKNRSLAAMAFKMMNPDMNSEDMLSRNLEQLKNEKSPNARAIIFVDVAKLYINTEIRDLDKAESYLDSAEASAEEDPTRIQVFLERANLAAERGDFQKARKIYTDRVIENSKARENQKEQAEFRLSNTFKQEENYRLAIENYQVFIEDYPSSRYKRFALMGMAECAEELGQIEEAVGYYERIIEEQEDEKVAGESVYQVGMLYAKNDKPGKAIEYWNDFMEENPESPTVPKLIFQMGVIHSSVIKKPSEAVKYFDRVINDYPGSAVQPYAAFQKGMIYQKRRDYDKALEAFELITEDNIETYRAAQGEIGRIIAMKDPEAAIENYLKIESASESVEDKAVARLGIGDVYLGQKRYDKAVESFKMVYNDYIEATDDKRAAAAVKVIDAY
ncbi:MAG: tetratricopeptide repeat protein, partial [Fibrobacterota bacterium]